MHTHIYCISWIPHCMAESVDKIESAQHLNNGQPSGVRQHCSRYRPRARPHNLTCDIVPTGHLTASSAASASCPVTGSAIRLPPSAVNRLCPYVIHTFPGTTRDDRARPFTDAGARARPVPAHIGQRLPVWSSLADDPAAATKLLRGVKQDWHHTRPAALTS